MLDALYELDVVSTVRRLSLGHETYIRGSELEQLFFCSGLADSTATQIKTPCLSE